MDPASDDALVERFSRDPHEIVRRAADDDPRLPPGTAVGLATDPDMGVRRRAGANPAVPPGELVTLLLTPHSAELAVRNPLLPVPVMHRMVTVAAPLVDAPPPPRPGCRGDRA
ncbi:hypothetical protein ACFYXS_26860 [Streptomyces sp. NPDC002574]|uniref:hypothetical protein n=1 Tax=Streptomyces sp. NPDC002574 TaxID=3364652 RepID=UPI0036762C18